MTAIANNPTPCPCGSGAAYDDCCGPYITGALNPPTAEALMRSRYSAYTQGDAKYLHATLAADQRDGDEPTADDLANVVWTGLDVRATENGGEDDDTGMVEFVARYKAGGETHVHHERAIFTREDGRWVYTDGAVSPKAPPAKSAKVGRNEPCPCGSGKKYKKCCGANA